ncbi:hypothetical protein ACFY3U_23695 [Micromonospora sp. NPDC000089]
MIFLRAAGGGRRAAGGGRPDYVDRLWNLVNWADVTAQFDAARATRPKT